MSKFRLDIYTWPAMQGVNPQMRTTLHETPEEAVAYLETQTEAYAYASLQRPIEGGHTPCDWQGQSIDAGGKWPLRHGTSGQHPAVVALKADWYRLIERVREIHREHGGAMVDIAADLLAVRHPQTHSWATNLAWEAAGP